MQICLRSAPLPPGLPRCSRRSLRSIPHPHPVPLPSPNNLPCGSLRNRSFWSEPRPLEPGGCQVLRCVITLHGLCPLPPAHTCSGGCVHHPRRWHLSGFLTSRLLGVPRHWGVQNTPPRNTVLGPVQLPTQQVLTRRLPLLQQVRRLPVRTAPPCPRTGKRAVSSQRRSPRPEVRLDRRTCDNHPAAVAFPSTSRRGPALAAPRAVGLASPTRGRSSSRTAHGLWSTQTKPSIWLSRFSFSFEKIPTCTDTKHVHARFCA